jgi:phenylacetic acid degradation operon negative regulatory protein
MTQERNTVGAGPAAGLFARPLSPRSLVVSLLLGNHPPRLPAALLVRWCEQFDIPAGTTRVALSRMLDRGELRARDGVYELAGGVRARQATQEWSLDPQLREPWDGTWRLHVVTGSGRGARARADLRAAARRCRLVEVREGVWTRPDNLPAAADAPGDRARLDAEAAPFTGHAGFDTAPLVERFDAPGWARRARDLVERLDGAGAALDSADGPALADAFVVLAAALQHVRGDPLLPAALLAADWPGPRLRAGYAAVQPEFAAAVARWFRAAGSRRDPARPG